MCLTTCLSLTVHILMKLQPILILFTLLHQHRLVSQENQIAECEAALNSRTEEIISIRNEKVELTGKLSDCESSLALAKAHIAELQAELLATQV